MSQVQHLSERSLKIRRLARIAILGAIALILFFLEFSVPLMPPFLKLDLSDYAALIAAFSMGPWAGVLVKLIQNVLHLPYTQTAMIGELANFLIGSALALVAGYFYRWKKSYKGALMSLGFGVLAMTVAGVVVNDLINIPFYVRFFGMPLEAIIEISRKMGNPMVTDYQSLLLWVFVPFNLIKGAFVSLLLLLTYKKLSPILHD